MIFYVPDPESFCPTDAKVYLEKTQLFSHGVKSPQNYQLDKEKPVLTTLPKTIQQKSEKSWLQNKKKSWRLLMENDFQNSLVDTQVALITTLFKTICRDSGSELLGA